MQLDMLCASQEAERERMLVLHSFPPFHSVQEPSPRSDATPTEEESSLMSSASLEMPSYPYPEVCF